MSTGAPPRWFHNFQTYGPCHERYWILSTLKMKTDEDKMSTFWEHVVNFTIRLCESQLHFSVRFTDWPWSFQMLSPSLLTATHATMWIASISMSLYSSQLKLKKLLTAWQRWDIYISILLFSSWGHHSWTLVLNENVWYFFLRTSMTWKWEGEDVAIRKCVWEKWILNYELVFQLKNFLTLSCTEYWDSL